MRQAQGGGQQGEQARPADRRSVAPARRVRRTLGDEGRNWHDQNQQETGEAKHGRTSYLALP